MLPDFLTSWLRSGWMTRAGGKATDVGNDNDGQHNDRLEYLGIVQKAWPLLVPRPRLLSTPLLSSPSSTDGTALHRIRTTSNPLFTFISHLPSFVFVASCDILANTKMQLKALAAIVSVAFTLGVQAAPNPFDHAAGVKGVLKRSYSHGKDMSQVSKRATALVAKKRDSNNQRLAGKQCKS